MGRLKQHTKVVNLVHNYIRFHYYFRVASLKLKDLKMYFFQPEILLVEKA